MEKKNLEESRAKILEERRFSIMTPNFNFAPGHKFLEMALV